MKDAPVTDGCPRCADARTVRRLRLAMSRATWAGIAGGGAACVALMPAMGMSEVVSMREVIALELGARFGAALGAIAAVATLALRVVAWGFERRSRRPGLARADLAEPYRAASGRSVCGVHPPA